MNENSVALSTPIPDAKIHSIFGIEISDLSMEEALQFLKRSMAYDQHVKLAFCNAHTANLAWGDRNYLNALKGFTVFVDGFGVDIAARVLRGSPFVANLNGTDLVPALLKQSEPALRIAMIGGQTGVAEKAVKAFQKTTPHHIFLTPLDGYASFEAQEDFISRLKSQPVDLLLVAMGNPKQEFWISGNITHEHAKVAIGVGALFDFMAGNVQRAPLWMRRARLEWLYRLLNEPKRLFRRYVLGNPLFLLRIALVKLGLRQF